MALHSVATPEAHPHRESDPYERLHSKIDGLQAITVLANVAIEQGDVTEKVWYPLWYFVGELCDDLQQDANELRLQRHRQRQEVA